MDLQNYKIKNSTKCECGYEFDIHNMTELKRIPDDKFYGGVIRHVSETECPECKKKTLLLLKQQGQTYIVKDIAQNEKHDHFVGNTEMVQDEKNDITIEMPIIENTPNNNSNEIICPVCKRSFKNKSGLTIHMKTHQNN